MMLRSSMPLLKSAIACCFLLLFFSACRSKLSSPKYLSGSIDIESLSEKEIKSLLYSGESQYVKIAVSTISSKKIEPLYKDVYDIFLNCNHYISDGCDMNLTGLLSNTVSKMGTDAIPFIEHSYINKDNNTNMPLITWLLGHLITRYKLSVLSDERVVNILKNILFDEKESWQTRLRAAGSLGRGGDKSGYELALRGLKEPPRDYDKMTAGWALGFIGESEGIELAIDVLINGLVSSDSRSVKQEAIHGLGNIGKNASNSNKAKIAEYVLPYLENKEKQLRLGATVCLGKIEWDPARQKIENILLTSHSDGELRLRAAQALMLIKNNSSSSILLHALKNDTSPRVRKWCLLALSKINSNFIKELEQFLKFEKNEVNLSIANRLLSRQKKEFVDIVVK